MDEPKVYFTYSSGQPVRTLGQLSLPRHSSLNDTPVHSSLSGVHRQSPGAVKKPDLSPRPSRLADQSPGPQRHQLQTMKTTMTHPIHLDGNEQTQGASRIPEKSPGSQRHQIHALDTIQQQPLYQSNLTSAHEQALGGSRMPEVSPGSQRHEIQSVHTPNGSRPRLSSFHDPPHHIREMVILCKKQIFKDKEIAVLKGSITQRIISKQNIYKLKNCGGSRVRIIYLLRT